MGGFEITDRHRSSAANEMRRLAELERTRKTQEAQGAEVQDDPAIIDRDTFRANFQLGAIGPGLSGGQDAVDLIYDLYQGQDGAAGLSEGELAQAFADLDLSEVPPELLGLVEGLYRSEFGRAADTVGRAHWSRIATDLRASGASDDQIRAQITDHFRASPEYQARLAGAPPAAPIGNLADLVEGVYQSELGRVADADGKGNWLRTAEQWRAEGQSDETIRDRMVEGFRRSDEYQRLHSDLTPVAQAAQKPADGNFPAWNFSLDQVPGGGYDASMDGDAVYSLPQIRACAPQMWAEYGDTFKQVASEMGVDPYALASYCVFESFHEGRGTFNPRMHHEAGGMEAAGIAATQAQDWAGRAIPGTDRQFPASQAETAEWLRSHPEDGLRCLATLLKGQYDSQGDLARAFPLTAFPAWGDPGIRRGAYGDQRTYASRAFAIYQAFKQADA